MPDSITEMRWRLHQAALRQDWETYHEIKEVLDQIYPPTAPYRADFRIFDPPCHRCGSRITCETCLADLNKML